MYINGKVEKEIPHLKFNYRINTNGDELSKSTLDRIGIPEADRRMMRRNTYWMPLDKTEVEELLKLKQVESVNTDLYVKGRSESVFPFIKTLRWNRDNYGPLWIPKAG